MWASTKYGYVVGQEEFTQVSARLAPVPATETVNIYIDSPDQLSISIFDLQGKLLHFEPSQLISGQHQIDLGDFAAGIYVIRLSGPQGHWTKKIIIE